MAGESCDDLLDYYVERGLELVGPYGWGSPFYDLRGGTVDFASPATSVRETASRLAYADQLSSELAPAPMAERAESSDTGTNVQEQDVDELDVVKTNGEQLFRVEDGTLTTDDVTGTEVVRESELDLGDLEDGEMFLAGDTVTVIGNDGTHVKRGYGYNEGAPPTTRVLSIDVSDPVKPEITATMDFDSSLITARLHGDTVRLITAAGLPELDFVQPTGGKQPFTEQSALKANEALVRKTTISDWLPTGSVDGGTDKRLAECEDVAVPKDDLGLDTMSVVGFDAAEPTTWDVTALAASAPLAYASEDHLYLGSSPTEWSGCFDFCPLTRTTAANEEAGTTHVFDFDLTTTGTSYVGAGEVDGMVQDRWSMDEHDGTLHLAVSPSQRTGNFNSIVNLRREGDALVEVGRLDKLGENETIQSVRWMGSLAILVTFRQIDPLYTIDLTDPEDPTLIGELKIPGFSEYLHPLGPNRLIGMGQGPVRQGRLGRGGRAVQGQGPDRPAPQGPGQLRPRHPGPGRCRPTAVHLAAGGAGRADRHLQGLERPHRLGLRALPRGRPADQPDGGGGVRRRDRGPPPGPAPRRPSGDEHRRRREVFRPVTVLDKLDHRSSSLSRRRWPT